MEEVVQHCMLSRILYFLPTKTFVETSILARRWRHIWKDVSVLDFFDDSLEFDDDNFQTFAVFVNRVFCLRNRYPIRKMRLSCTKSLVNDYFCESSVDTWVRSVIGPDLILDTEEDYFDFCLPIPLSACTNLFSLRQAHSIHFL